MIAAVYARKSTDQNAVADEQKSIARQVDHARQYAQRKGWTVDDAHIYIDDGISGAEFANRPGYLRLLNALKPVADTFGHSAGDLIAAAGVDGTKRPEELTLADIARLSRAVL